jgi:diguanylate cyclase (GGDEF)-like protein
MLVAGLVVIVQVGWGLSVVQSDSNLLRAEAERRGMQVLRALSVPCAVALANREIETLDSVLASFTGEDTRDLEILSIAILDSEGRVIAHTDPVQFGVQAEDAFTKSALSSETQVVIQEGVSSDAPLMLLSMPIISGLRWGTATAVLSLESVEQQIRKNRTRVLLLSILLSALVGLLLSLVLRRTVLRPLHRLTDAANQISSGHLGARVVSSPRSDEMSLLGEVFNEMAEKVQWQTEALEGRVAERTQQLRQTNLELETAVAKLEELARTDGLTSLRNHRAFQEAFAFELERSRRTKRPLSLIMLDVDHFKAYNDTHGHPGGDRVLRSVAKILQANLRTVDVVARYGGEEFVVLLLETPGLDAALVAEKLRAAVADTPFEGAEASQPGGKLTISLGLASFPLQATTGEALLALADAALYRAKHAGRNQVWRDPSRDS